MVTAPTAVKGSNTIYDAANNVGQEASVANAEVGVGGTGSTNQNAKDANLGSTAGTRVYATGATIKVALDGVDAELVTLAAAAAAGVAVKATTFKTFVVTGVDNSSSGTYAATGVVAGSKVVAAFAASTGVTGSLVAVAGAITVAADSIIVTGGANLSTNHDNVVFVVAI